MEEQNSMKINQLPSKTWYWLGLNDTKVKWAAGAPCEICAEEPSADDEITGFPEAMNTGAGKETDVLFAPEQTKNWSVSAKEGQTKQSRFPSDREKRRFHPERSARRQKRELPLPFSRYLNRHRQRDSSRCGQNFTRKKTAASGSCR